MDEIIRKIVKLFELGNKARNNSEAEAEAAFLKAQELMRKYGIEQAAIDKKANAFDLSKFSKMPTGLTRTKLGRDDWNIASAVGYICSCHPLAIHVMAKGKWQQSLIFIGYTSDAMVAVEMYGRLRKYIRKMAAQWCRDRDYPLYKIHWKSYVMGFARKLLERAQQARREADAKDVKDAGLIVYREDMAKKATEEMFPNAQTRKSRPAKVDLNAYGAGADEAKNIDIGGHRLK